MPGTLYKRLPWDEWYALASDYYEKNGNLRIPREYSVEGYKLGRWIERMRAAYHGNGTSNIYSDQIIMLEHIGMEWKLEWRFSRRKWLVQIRKYYKEHGNIRVPRNYSTGAYQLGNWLMEQRRKRSQGKLKEKQIEELDAFDMEWTLMAKRLPWDEWYALARQYYISHGNLNIPYNYCTEDGEKLGQWLGIQRQCYRGSRQQPLAKERYKALSEIGMNW